MKTWENNFRKFNYWQYHTWENSKQQCFMFRILYLKNVIHKYFILVISSWGAINLPKFGLELCNKSFISSYKVHWQRTINPHCYNGTHPQIPRVQGIPQTQGHKEYVNSYRQHSTLKIESGSQGHVIMQLQQTENLFKLCRN